jgi:hypothetical protein
MAIAVWMIASAVLLPLAVGGIAFWMRREKGQRKALLVDAVFAVGWTLILVFGILYVWANRVQL